MNISPAAALSQLSNSAEEFVTLFKHGSLEVEIYSPGRTDKQQPHTRDEVYVIISGKGKFFHNGTISDFGPGEFIFVPAGDEHRFVEFSEDFSTWVIFYGPEGGENK